MCPYYERTALRGPASDPATSAGSGSGSPGEVGEWVGPCPSRHGAWDWSLNSAVYQELHDRMEEVGTSKHAMLSEGHVNRTKLRLYKKKNNHFISTSSLSGLRS